MGVGSHIRRDHRDTAFRKLFSQSENFLDLYKECSGRQLNVRDVKPFDLAKDDRLFGILRGSGLVNDVSYITTDNRLIVLTEHQCTPNKNMPERELLYYAALLRRWLADREIELSGTASVDIPMPEFYLAYNGKEMYKEETLSLGNEFLSVKIKLVDIHFEKLTVQHTDNSLAAYSYFYKHYDAKISEGITIDEAAQFAGKQCKQAGYMIGKINWEDFVMQNKSLFSYEADIRAASREEGRREGKLEGKSEMARNLAQKGFPIADIADIAELPISEVEKILQ